MRFQLVDDDNDDTEEPVLEEKEPPHPLGFDGAWGRTRFGLPSEQESLTRYKERLGYPMGGEDDLEWESFQSPKHLSYKVAPTAALLKLLSPPIPKIDTMRDDMEHVCQLLQSTSLVPRREELRITQGTPSDMSQVRREQMQLEDEHRQATERLQRLIDKEEAALNQERKEKQQALEAEQAAQEEADRKEQARRVAEEKEAEAKATQEKEELKVKEEKARVDKEKTQAEEAKRKEQAKESDYVGRAEKLMAQLVQVRASVAPFEKSKTMAKRRLNIKKTINGKVNTLSEDAHKIKAVAADISAVIAQTRQEDEQIKQMLAQGSKEVTAEHARGKRYMLDLLASKVVVRAQANTFKGAAGDGFPVASMLAFLSIDNPDMNPIVAAHLYTVCPYVIPKLPSASADASEEDFMKDLGMTQDKDGKFETFEAFLARTENVVGLYADILASNPPNHSLMGGNEGAIKWLKRFLSALSDDVSTLPLFTAPVLNAFLSRAGHMMAKKYPDHFKVLLQKIEKSIIPRLDESALGSSSALRLKSTVGIGFEGFSVKLPPKALTELYSGAGASSVSSTGVSSSPFRGERNISVASSAFSTSGAPAPSSLGMANTSSAPSPFGSASNVPAPSPFGMSTTPATSTFGSSAPAPSPFGQSNTAPAPSPFGASNNASAPSPFGASSASPGPSPFGAPSAAPGPSPFGTSSAAPTAPFGTMNSASVQSPFGSTNHAPAPSPFGAAPSAAPTSSPFGNQATAPSPFTSSFNAPAPSPFGNAAINQSSPFGGQQAPAPSGFGESSTSPFGSGMAPSPSPFGTSGMAPSPSPFGASAMQTQSAFGSSGNPFGGQASSNSSPFGAPSATAAQSPFGGAPTQGQSPFGSSNTATNASPFGSAPTAPFGSPAPAFGGSSTQSPFGAPASTPFGGNSNQSTFGSQQTQSPFGSRSKSSRPPCRFFAQGRCNRGANCNYSHDNPPQQQQSQFGGNSFGGPRR